MMKTKHTYYIQIPTEIVRGEYCKLDSRTFVLYAFLLYKEFKHFTKGATMEIDHMTMKATTQINDNRTLKKCFLKLHEVGLVKELIDTFPSNGYLNVTLNLPFKSKRFTQLPSIIFTRLLEMGHNGFRLLYYYESYINRKDALKTFAHPSYDLIRAHTLLSDDTLTKYNNLLSELQLLKITKHKVEMNVDLDRDRFMRWNNHYQVILHNL